MVIGLQDAVLVKRNKGWNIVFGRPSVNFVTLAQHLVSLKQLEDVGNSESVHDVLLLELRFFIECLDRPFNALLELDLLFVSQLVRFLNYLDACNFLFSRQ